MTKQELIREAMITRKLSELEAVAVIKLLEGMKIITFTPDDQLAYNPKKFNVGY
ncbi:hypothetical protein [Streptococcus merionis]|uniref:hypothetical protein n=1 Tax=Streptococcus merionis TaxID=400065 RepID=UPI0026EFC9ED|nr:hypothetical protein [Streptococcus merionis]